MFFTVITIFPEAFKSYLEQSVISKAIEKGIAGIDIVDLRNYADGKHKVVDDYPYGGEAGMVMKPEPITRCITDLKTRDVSKSAKTVFLTPDGELFTQKKAIELAAEKSLILLCGRYKGIDERVRESIVDHEISIGNYVLTGGELPAMVVIDSVMRMLPGTLGNIESAENDSFFNGLLSSPVYTRPPEFQGMKVPDVLLSGNHKQINEWKIKESLRRTMKRRPDLLETVKLSDKDKALLEKLMKETEKDD